MVKGSVLCSSPWGGAACSAENGTAHQEPARLSTGNHQPWDSWHHPRQLQTMTSTSSDERLCQLHKQM